MQLGSLCAHGSDLAPSKDTERAEHSWPAGGLDCPPAGPAAQVRSQEEALQGPWPLTRSVGGRAGESCYSQLLFSFSFWEKKNKGVHIFQLTQALSLRLVLEQHQTCLLYPSGHLTPTYLFLLMRQK